MITAAEKLRKRRESRPSRLLSRRMKRSKLQARNRGIDSAMSRGRWQTYAI